MPLASWKLTAVPSPLEKAEARLGLLFGMDARTAARAVAEVLDCFQWDVDTYVRERHAELQAAGIANEAIYAQLGAELSELRFRSPPLSARQLRRRIYG